MRFSDTCRQAAFNRGQKKSCLRQLRTSVGFERFTCSRRADSCTSTILGPAIHGIGHSPIMNSTGRWVQWLSLLDLFNPSRCGTRTKSPWVRVLHGRAMRIPHPVRASSASYGDQRRCGAGSNGTEVSVGTLFSSTRICPRISPCGKSRV